MTGAEEVQRPDDLLAPPQGRLNCGEACLQGCRREPRPAFLLGGQVRRFNGLAGPEAVQARTLIVL